MKPLDITKKYDLSQLNDEQLQDVYKATFTPMCIIKCDYLYFDEDKWFFTTNNKGNTTNALELFKENKSVYDDILSLIEKGKQHGLKIVVTFEKL